MNRAIKLLILFAPVIIAVFCFYGTDHFFKNQYDDGYITYRYAINFSRGNGMVFNVGERTDAASSFSYTVLLAFLYKIGFTNLELAGGFVGLISLAMIVLLVYKIAIVIAENEFFAIFLAFACGINGFLSGWTLSGMETLFWTAIVTVFFWLMVRDSNPVLLFFSVALAAFTRFEGSLLIIALVLHLNNRRNLSKYWLAVLIIITALGVFYWVKHEYYGVWISHAYLMKSIAGYYQPDPVEIIRLWIRYGSVSIFLGLIGLLKDRKYSSILVYILLSSFSVLFGPKSDWARYSVHLLPILYAFSAMGVQFLTAKVLSILNTFSSRPLLIRSTISIIFVLIMMLQAERGIEFNRMNMINLSSHQICRKQLGLYIDATIPRNEVIASRDIGAIAYFAIDHRFVDLLGLVSSDVLSAYEKRDNADSILTVKDVKYLADTFQSGTFDSSDVIFGCSAGGFQFNLVLIKQ